jgi:acyl-CoA thioester hydrolase
MISTIRIEPRYQETDQMGIIHHSVYPIWYEMGRVKYCEDIGLPFHVIEEKGVRLAMYHLTSRYLKPTLFGRVYQMETQLVNVSKVRLHFEYTLYDQNGEKVHVGTTELIWLNQDLKPTNVAKTHPDIYEAFVKERES